MIVLRLNILVQPMIIVMIAIAGLWNNRVILSTTMHVVPSIDCKKSAGAADNEYVLSVVGWR